MNDEPIEGEEIQAAVGCLLPAGWLHARLEDVASNDRNSIVDGPFGSNLKLIDYIEDNSGVPVLTTKNLERGYSEDNLRYISHVKFEELKRSEVRGGDILVAKIGSCGKTGIYPFNMPSAIIPANLLKMTVHPLMQRYYVFHFLNSRQFKGELDEIITATAQPAFNVSKFRKLNIPVAPLPEQDRIVAKIEELFTQLDAGVAALKRVQANLKRYKAAVLKAACEGKLVPQDPNDEPASVLLERILAERRAKWEADLRAKGKDPAKVKYEEPAPPDTEGLPELPEGWCWVTVGAVSTKVVDGVHKKPNYVDHGIPFVTVRNLTAGHGISFSKLNYITAADHAEYRKRANPERGDILITKDGTLGVVRVIRTDVEFSIFVSVALIKPVAIEMGDYLGIALSSPQVQAQMVPKGSGLVHIHLEDLREDCVPLAPISEQERIVAEVERRMSVVQKLDAIVEANLKRAERLRQSILKQAFEGKLVPQDPSDEPADVLLQRVRAERGNRGQPTARRAIRSQKVQSGVSWPEEPPSNYEQYSLPLRY